MLRPERILLVSHPILAPINEDQMLNAMPDEHQRAKRSPISIEPIRLTLAELAAIDWADVCLSQERELKSKLEPELRNASGYRLAYFGLAPIPLALHLGYRVGGMIDMDVYLLHHERKTWAWPEADQEPAPLDLLDVKPPQDISRARGDVIVRVSVSHRIDPVETLEVVPDPLCEIDIGLVHPNEDALRSPKDLDAIVHQFNKAIDGVKDRLPNIERIHLFAAVPVGLAFRLGTCLNPTIHAPVQTYQYFAQRSPRYESGGGGAGGGDAQAHRRGARSSEGVRRVAARAGGEAERRSEMVGARPSKDHRWFPWSSGAARPSVRDTPAEG
jgi:hypothetical protein